MIPWKSSPSSSAFRDFCGGFEVDLIDVKQYGRTVYYCLYEAGVGYGFEVDCLVSVDYYQPDGLRSKYSKCTQETISFPGILLESRGKDIVGLLGEPDEKGGGGRNLDIWSDPPGLLQIKTDSNSGVDGEKWASRSISQLEIG